MFEKRAKTIEYKMPIEALYVPTKGAWSLYNTSRIKVASIDKTKNTDLGGFDLVAAIEKNPDNLFVKVFAIKANEVNDNGDCFNESELKKSAKTFVGVPVFVNHQNDNVENARGKVVHSWYDEDAKGIYCINMVDREAYPRLARGIEENYITGCFPPDAPVLMADGTEKPIVDIESGDYVISGKGNICKVLGKRQRGYDYPLLSIQTEGIKNDLVLTAYHNIYVYRLPKDCAYDCGMALSACEDKRITGNNLSKILRQGHNPSGVKINHEYIQKIKACEIEEGDFLIEPKYLDDSFDRISEDEAFLIGLFLAEGSFEKRDGIRHSAIFNFSHKELETLAFRCSELLEKVFPNHKNKPTTNYYPGSSQTRVCFYGKEIADWFYKYCGEYSNEKKLHSDLLKLNSSTTASLLAGYVEGDGWNVKDKTYGVSTVSKDLASQLRLMFAKIGIRSKFRKVEVKTGYKAKTGGYTSAYNIEFGLTTAENLIDKLVYKKTKINEYKKAKFHNLDNITIRKIKAIKEIEYSGIVYDIEVENDHSYCVNHLMVSNTSMGAQVGYSLCSICHNKASTADDFCSHIKNGKNRKISGKHECKYHDSPCGPTDQCPLDGTKKGDVHELLHKEAKVYEWNYDIKFIEDSFVVNPACHDCLVCDILNIDAVKKVTSSKILELKKVASDLSEKVNAMTDGSIEKTAGKTEVEALTQAMNLMEHVARSMMAQKQQIQLDYVSDLVEHLANVQSLTDELVEMGYAQLPSPPDQQIALGNMMQAPTGGQSQQVMNPAQVGQQQPAQSLAKPYSSSSASLGDLGSVTRPTFTGASEELKKDFLKQSKNISSKLENVSSSLRGSLLLLAQRSMEVTNSEHIAEFSNGNLKVTVANVEGDGLVVGKWKDNKLVSWASVEEFGDEIKCLAASNPQEAAKIIISQYQKELGVNMSANITKVSSGDTSQQEVVTQKQLDSAGPLHPREDKYPTVITQAQLEGKGELKPVNDTTSDDNQLRKGDSPEVITQAQLESLDGPLARWNDFPEVITQDQWNEMSRRVSSSLGSDYTDQTTQAQLQSLQKSHKWSPPETITQDQLNSQKKVSPEGKSDSERWASSAKNLVKAASATVADAIANYGLTPSDVAKAMNQISSSPYATIKASYLALVNGSPVKIEARIAERKRSNYFAKTANSSSNISPINGILSAMGDNISYLKAEDFVSAVKFVVTDKKAFASAEIAAQVKLASRNDDNIEVVDSENEFRQAFAELDRPEDGLYKICGTLTEDVKVDPYDKATFMNALFSFAKNNIDVPFVIAKVDLDKEAGVFEIDCKEERCCSSEEKTAFAYALTQVKTATQKPQPSNKTARSTNRSNLVKEAQMMGGQMGGGMGGGGPQAGAGATMPGADAAGGAPPAENLGGQPGELGGEGEDMMGGEDEDMQPKPPGTICPVCGSSDVDVLDGKGKCGNCSAEFSYKVLLEITKYPGLLDSGGDDDVDKKGEDEGGKGFALPEGNNPAILPVAAMTQIRPEMIKKAAEDAKASGREWSIGSISPYTGSTSVMKVNANKFLCLDTGATYEVHVAGVQNKGKKAIFAEWRFNALSLAHNCVSCRRKKNAFASALKTHGINEEVFDSMFIFDKGKTILAMKDKGLFNNIKTASKGSSVLSSLKKTAGFGSKFPIETCREKIARKYGENALALSGPCEGSNLADCVCKRLATAGVYSNDIAVKVASVWAGEDQMIQCVEDFVRSKKFSMKQACFVCDQLKTKYAQFDDSIADELGGESGGSTPTGGENSHTESPMGEDSDGDEFANEDPFAGDEGGDIGGESSSIEPTDNEPTDSEPMEAEPMEVEPMEVEPMEVEVKSLPMGGEIPGGASGQKVTVELPLDVVQHLDKAFDAAQGGGLGGDLVQELGGALGGAMEAIDQAVGEAPGEVDSNPVEHADAPEGGEIGESEVPSESEDTEFSSSEGEESSESHVEGEESSEGEEFSEETDNSDSDPLNKEGNELEKHHMAQADLSARTFKKGKIGGTGEINLDLSEVMNVLAKQNKQLKTAKELVVKEVQKDKDIGKYQGDSTMGHEEKFDAKEPDIFTGDATMGGEKDAGYDNDKPNASFESGGAEMGDEKAQGYTAEKQNVITQNHRMVGASSKSRVSTLAESIINAAQKTASDKKMQISKGLQEDGDIKPFAANKDNPKSGNPIKPQDSADIGKVESGDSSFLGHEKETLTSVPKETNSAPSIPAGGGKNPKYDTKNDAEKQTVLNKGTVIASGDTESLAARKEAATMVAGRKLKAGMITIDKLASEIEKLSRYETSDLKDINATLFGASKKGLDTVARGAEKALVISEKSNQRKIASELKDSLQSLFTLDKRNVQAQDDPTTDIRKSNYRS